MKALRFIVITILLFGVFAMFRPRYFIRKDLNAYVHILSTTNEAFVFVGRSTTKQCGSMAGILVKSFLTIYPQVFDGCEDLIVIHTKNGRANKFDLKGFGFGGRAFPRHGSIYFGRGGRQPDGRSLWIWNGTNIVDVEKASAEEIWNSFALFTSVIKEEGWKEMEARFNDGESVTTIALGAGRIRLNLKEDGDSRSMIIRGEGIAMNEEVSIREETQSKSVSKQIYFEECPQH